MTKSEWSGWVQAVGSIAAILGAVWLAVRQIRHAREQALELEKRRLIRQHNAVMSVALHARTVLNEFGAAVEGIKAATFDPVEWGHGNGVNLETVGDELKWAMELSSESFHMVAGIRALTSIVMYSREVDRRIRDEAPHLPARVNQFNSMGANIRKIADGAIGVLQNAQREFDEDPDIALSGVS